MTEPSSGSSGSPRIESAPLSPSAKQEEKVGSMDEHLVQSNPQTLQEREVEKIKYVTQDRILQKASSVVKKSDEVHRVYKRAAPEQARDKIRETVIPFEQQSKSPTLELLLPTGSISGLASMSEGPKSELQLKVETGLIPRIPFPGGPHGPTTILQRMDDLAVPGVSIAVINNGEVVWSEGYGELKQKELLTQAASISKIVTSLTILSLIQDGKISLETDLKDVLDNDLWEKINPKHRYHQAAPFSYSWSIVRKEGEPLLQHRGN